MSDEKYPGWEQVQFVPQRDLADMTERGWRLLETDSANETVLVGKKRDDRIEELKGEIQRLKNEERLSLVTIDDLVSARDEHKRRHIEAEKTIDKLNEALTSQVAHGRRMAEALQRYEADLGKIRQHFGQKAIDEAIGLPPIKILYPELPKGVDAATAYIAELKAFQKRTTVCGGTMTGRIDCSKPNHSNPPRSGRLNAYGQDIDDM